MTHARFAYLSILVAVAVLLVSCGEESAPDRLPIQPALHPVPGVSWAGVSQIQLDASKALGVPAAFENDWGMRFVLIPAGTFRMGSPEDEPERHEHETQHTVHIGRAFYLQVRTLTWTHLHAARLLSSEKAKIFERYVAEEDPAGRLAQYGAEPPEWGELVAGLNTRDTARTYRFPTEAEWEYAMRAGTQSAYWWGGRPLRGEAEVKRFRENPWGLKSLAVFEDELCSDIYAPLPSHEVSDPRGASVPGDHVVRWAGRLAARGSWNLLFTIGNLPTLPRLRLVSPVGYGLGNYGSANITFRLVDREGKDAPNLDYDLRVISMNDRLAARTRGVDATWQRVSRPALPATLSMVPGAYYVYAEGRRAGQLVRGTEQKFHAKAGALVRTVPVPEKDLSRFGSGAREEPK